MPFYLERTDEKLAMQMHHFASEIETYADTFGFTAIEMAALKADATYFSWAIHKMEQIADCQKNWMAFKAILLKGENEVPLYTTPELPVPEYPPAVVPEGVLLRFTAAVNRVTGHQAYTRNIGQGLGIETVVPCDRPMPADKPVLTLSVCKGRVQIRWAKGCFTGILLEKDSGTGFMLLDKDFMQDYTDPELLPQGMSSIWRYRAIYLQGDDTVGRWSDISGITVGGW